MTEKLEGKSQGGSPKELRTALKECLGDEPRQVAPEPTISRKVGRKCYFEQRLEFTSEEGARVPGYLLLPKRGNPPFPAAVCLQGHSPGMHLSLGRPRTAKEFLLVALGARDIAVQAVRHGFAAVALEQRCFGLRRDTRPESVRQNNHSCQHATMNALLAGRTLMGERVWDLRRAVDVLTEIDEIDSERITCVGHSAGGSVAWYAMSLDTRIAGGIISCALCGYHESIGTRDHCMDNYLPGALKHFDMGMLGACIAPRPVVVAAGRNDRIFPLQGVERAYTAVSDAYRAGECEDRCRLVVGSGGHRFYPEPVWKRFRDMMRKKERGTHET